MTQEEQIGFTQLVFTRFMRLDDTKLQRGLNRRQTMLAAAKSGVVVETARTVWLKTTTHALLSVLKAAAGAFNESQDDDRISIQDFLDALSSAARILKK